MSCERCKKGYQSGEKTFKVHLDGYNLMPFFKGEVKESPRKEFLYWSDDGDLMAIRVQQLEDRLSWSSTSTGLDVWKREFTNLRAPNIYNLRTDPFERGPNRSNTAGGWRIGRSSSCQHRRWWLSGSRASRNSRSGRSPRASTSTR